MYRKENPIQENMNLISRAPARLVLKIRQVFLSFPIKHSHKNKFEPFYPITAHYHNVSFPLGVCVYVLSQWIPVSSDTFPSSYLTSSEWQDMYVTFVGSLDQQHIIPRNQFGGLNYSHSFRPQNIIIRMCLIFIQPHKQEYKDFVWYFVPNNSWVKILSPSQTKSSIKFASVLPNWSPFALQRVPK